ncbi:hypothetical protein GGQ84_000615 [Desulfitispora alkaliphila]|uniref:DUF2922 domain-containing protein n=1 Tax=Desulfitispora alkaliphila TaxID=622674 RepID=UPI003D1C3F79
MINTVTRLEMIFTHSGGGRVTVPVQDPREDLTGEEVEQVMQEIIERGVFEAAGADLVAIQSARIVTREVEPIELISEQE